MALKYLGGTLPSIGVYAIVPGLIQRLPSGRWDLNAETVTSVEVEGSGKQYNYAAGGVGIVAGAAFAGPLGAVVGGLAPNAFKDDVVRFVIHFRNGDVAHFAGTPGDYKRALKSSYKPVNQAPRGPQDTPEAEQLRAERAAERAAKRAAQPPAPPKTIEEVRAEMAAERDARAATSPEGQPRIWFADVAERQYATRNPNETPAERKQREVQDEQNRKEYKAALQVVRKQHEKAIQKAKMPLKERLRLLGEIEKEFGYRTSK